MNKQKQISVLHVTYNDVLGGAARYVTRLHNSLLKFNIDSKILVLSKDSDNPRTIASNKNKLKKGFSSSIDKLPLLFYKERKLKFSPGLYNDFVTSQIEEINPDIVHLHWINNGLISISSLAKIKQPIVWSVLDMWPFTGGCHYDNWCERFTKECGKCPVLISEKENDLSKKVLKRKIKVFNKVDFTVVAISNWIKECVERSTAMGDKEVKVIHPSLDLNLFRPIDKKFCRDLFNLPKDKKLILFGAVNSTSDKRKGFSQLIGALKKITDKVLLDNTELVVFGATNADFEKELKMKVNFVGRLASGYGSFDDSSLSALYSATDLTITPSLQEAFGQVAIESLACGVPVVAFESTGIDDIITHKEDGYLANHNDTSDLLNGVMWGLENSNKENIKENTINKTKQKFDDRITAIQMIDVYKNKMIKK